MTKISSVLVLMFANKGITDNTDLMRCSILAMTIERMISTESIPTLEEVKSTSAFASVSYNVGCPDEFLQELIGKAVELYEKK